MRTLTSNPTLSRRPAALVRGLGFAVSLLVASCTPLLAEGQFRCDPEAEAPCPPGYACQRRAGDGSFRCFQHPGDVCGDNVAGPSEQCDGDDLGGARCGDFGFFAGELRCSEGCEVSTDGCVLLQSVGLSLEHGCGLDEQGGVWCWGTGGGGWADSEAPARLSLPRPVVSLQTGYEHVLALDDEGRAWCWGKSDNCGVGVTVWSLREPTPVVGEHAFVQLSASRYQSCGLKESGEVWCWGELVVVDEEGARLEWSGVPERIETPTPYASVTVGSLHACGLDAEGGAWCWGANEHGQLGVGTTDATSTPLSVEGGLVLSELHARHEYTCGLDTDSGLWCWGLEQGPLGLADDATRLVPVRQQADWSFRSVTPGHGQICAVDEASSAWCWGSTDDVPEPLFPEREVQTLWTSYFQDTVCALDGHGDVWCQGWNGGAQLAEPVARSVPRAVAGGPFDKIGVGYGLGCGLREGVAHCWGSELLGDGSYHRHPTPQPVAISAPAAFAALDVGGSHACALDEQGFIWCWGHDGVGVAAYAPEQVSQTGGFKAISAGSTYTCALDSQGKAWCWGLTNRGRLGTPTLEPLAEPTAVVGGRSFETISANWGVTCALDAAGQAWCWGRNYDGGCGRPITELDFTWTPVAVQGDLTLASVVTFSNGACGIDHVGRTWCWGNGTGGATGVGMLASHDVPLQVVGGHELVSLAAGYHHVCGLDTDQRAWCWGSNWSGSLGDGTRERRTEPTAVTGDHRFTSLVALGYVTCGLDTDGQAWCWGANELGQAGADDRFHEPVLLRDD